MSSKKKNTEKKRKILYIAFSRSSFVQTDLSILRYKYKVIENIDPWNKKKYTPFYLFKQTFLLYHLPKAKAVFISSAGYWSLIPVLLSKAFNKPVYIIINGSEAASIPEVNYGDLRKTFLKRIIKISYKYASALLPVSKSLIFTENDFHFHNISRYQGVQYFFPDLKINYKIIPNGFDVNFWKKEENVSKEPQIFVAVFAESQFILKGGDLIKETAAELTNDLFYIAGMNKPPNMRIPPNLHFLGPQKQEELRRLYSKSSYFLQLSIFEGFGCALAEAMLCECIPIVSRVNILPEIVGDSGFVVHKKNVADLIEAISKAKKANFKQLSTAARQQILDNYSLDIRKHLLLDLIDENSVKNK